LLQPQPPASANQKFAWDQVALDLAEAQGYTYKYYPDGSTTGVVFQNVTCTGAASPFVCTTPIPAFTPGNHTITITAGNVAGESDKSDPFAFAFVVTPGKPTRIRIGG
jgi:hypothetical protein